MTKNRDPPHTPKKYIFTPTPKSVIKAKKQSIIDDRFIHSNKGLGFGSARDLANIVKQRKMVSKDAGVSNNDLNEFI